MLACMAAIANKGRTHTHTDISMEITAVHLRPLLPATPPASVGQCYSKVIISNDVVLYEHVLLFVFIAIKRGGGR